jgi:hypothetical protein
MRLTREYFGGVLAGCGVGTLLTRALLYTDGAYISLHPLTMVAAFLLIAAGTGLARSGQRKRDIQN